MTCNRAHCALAIEIFFKTGESSISTQIAFGTHFSSSLNHAVLDKKLILLRLKIIISDSDCLPFHSLSIAPGMKKQ